MVEIGERYIYHEHHVVLELKNMASKNKNKKKREETEAEEQREMEEFVWIADGVKCKQNVVMEFVKKNGLTAQEAFEEEACIHAGSKACEQCDHRVKE